MAKLTDIFARRSSQEDSIIPLSHAVFKAGAASVDTQITPALGALAERNEALRNLVMDTGRRIADLADLNVMFGNLAKPLGEALDTLEEEKARSLSLASRVEEQDREIGALQSELKALEKRTTESETVAERLQSELRAASSHNRALQHEREELLATIRDSSVESTELNRRIDEAAVLQQSLMESGQALREQIGQSEKRVLELEGEIARAQGRISTLESENQSLQRALEEAQNESSRLTRRSVESENVVAEMRGQLGRLELSEQMMKAEKSRLGSALEQATQQHQNERQALTSRIEGLQARASTAEGLLAQTRQSLNTRTEEARASDRKAIDTTVALASAERRVQQLEAIQERNAHKIRDLEVSFESLKAESSMTVKVLEGKEAALAQANAKVSEVSNRHRELESDLQIARKSADTREAELNAALASERGERSRLEGTLAEARRENERLRLRIRNLRRGDSTEESVANLPDSTEAPALIKVEQKRSAV